MSSDGGNVIVISQNFIWVDCQRSAEIFALLAQK